MSVYQQDQYVPKGFTIYSKKLLSFGCNSPANLMELIETNLDLEEKLETFEGAFEQDEVVKMWLIGFSF